MPRRSRGMARDNQGGGPESGTSADAAASAPARARPTGVAMTKPAFGAVEEHARRGQGVQAEEAGAGQEGERDERDARVGAALGGDAGGVGEGAGQHRGREHQPEVRGVVRPAAVDRGDDQQQPDAEHRQGEQGADARGRGAGRLDGGLHAGRAYGGGCPRVLGPASRPHAR